MARNAAGRQPDRSLFATHADAILRAKMNRFRSLTLAAVIATLTGCGVTPLLTVYRIDIQQGNVITQEQLAALERGMEKRKVQFILGTPLLADTFNQDRWDYYYSLDRRGEERVHRVISVFFDGDRLVRIGGDVEPALGPIVVDTRKDEVVSVPDGYRDEGLLASLTPAFLSGKATKAEPDETSAPDADASTGEAEQQPPLAITTEDERYLRELMAGFGQDQQVEQVAGRGDVEEASEQDSEQTEDESIFSRWARNLGLTDEPTQSSPPPAGPPRELELE